MAAVLLLTIIGISGATDREAGGASFANTQAKLVASANDPGVGPVAGWVADILELLDKLIKTLEDAEEEAGQSARNGATALGQLEPDWLAIYLDLAEADIDQILDGNQYPSLTPVDAGDVDPTVLALTLSEHASTCVVLAQQAFDELLIGPTPAPTDHEVVGTKLKTIKALLPEYRALAGIE